MKKKVVISIAAVVLVVVIGIIGFILFNNNKISSIITLDINPSMELKLDDKNKVIKVKALNADAKSLISDDLKTDYDEAILKIIDKVRDKQEFKDDRLFVLVNSTGKLNKVKIQEKLTEKIMERNIAVDIIVPDEITKEDKDLAKKYNITEAKANYLNNIKKEHPEISIENIVDDSIENLHETKETGNTCPDGYKIDGEYCIKEIKREKANLDKVCPEGYAGDREICYKEGSYIEGDKLTCRSDFQLNGDKCEKTEERDARGKCEEGGEYHYEQMKCMYRENLGSGEEYCRITPSTDLLYNGRCLGRKPTINGGCLGSDKVINGWCYDTSANSGYEAEWKCPDGALVSHADYERDGNTCYKRTFKDHLGLYCDEEGFTLEGKKCVKYEIEDAYKERICESGYTLLNNDRCINTNDTKALVDGYICNNPNSRVIGDTCVIYEKIKSKH